MREIMNMYPKITVIMSTYNGQRYLRQQINSVLGQNYPNVELIIRDDGSKDNTRLILEEYEKNERVSVIYGDNIGFCQSFCTTLGCNDDSEFYAFCDQDDIWYSDKLTSAFRCLRDKSPDIPQLYYCHVNEINENGDSIGIRKLSPGSVSFRRTMTGCFGEGMAMVINKKCRNLMLKMNPQKMDAHDWAASAVALGMGQVFVDNGIFADHRRLAESVSIVTLPKRILWFCSEIIGENNIRMRNKEYFRCFGDNLSIDNYRIAEAFGKDRLTIRTQLHKVFSLRCWRPNILSEISMRILMILGKI